MMRTTLWFEWWSHSLRPLWPWDVGLARHNLGLLAVIAPEDIVPDRLRRLLAGTWHYWWLPRKYRHAWNIGDNDSIGIKRNINRRYIILGLMTSQLALWFWVKGVSNEYILSARKGPHAQAHVYIIYSSRIFVWISYLDGCWHRDSVVPVAGGKWRKVRLLEIDLG